jgi:hypothetical protein
MKISKILFTTIVCCFVFMQQSKAQIPVTDAAHIAVNVDAWVLQLAKAANQISTLVESADHLNETINLYKKINSSVKNIQTLTNLLDMQVKLVSMAGDVLSIPSDQIGSQKAYNTFRTRILSIIEKNNHNTSVLKDFVKAGTFQMNDAERIAAFESIQAKTSNLYTEIYNAKFAFEQTNRTMMAIKRLED